MADETDVPGEGQEAAEPEVGEREMNLRRIEGLALIVLQCKQELDQAEATVRVKRKAHERATLDVIAAADESRNGREATLFDGGRPAAEFTAEQLDALRREAEMKRLGVEKPTEADAWRRLDITALGLTQKQVDSLKAYQPGGKGEGLTTLGALADYQSRDGKFTDVPGIGKSGADKIERAILDYFTRNPVPAAEEPAAAPATEQPAEPVATEPAGGEQVEAAAEPQAEPADDMTPEERAEAQREAAAEAGEIEGDEG